LVEPNAILNNYRWPHQANQSTIESWSGVHSQWRSMYFSGRLWRSHGTHQPELQHHIKAAWLLFGRESY